MEKNHCGFPWISCIYYLEEISAGIHLQSHHAKVINHEKIKVAIVVHFVIQNPICFSLFQCMNQCIGTLIAYCFKLIESCDTEIAGKIGLTTAGRAGDQKISSFIDPFTCHEPKNVICIQLPLRIIDRIIQNCRRIFLKARMKISCFWVLRVESLLCLIQPVVNNLIH